MGNVINFQDYKDEILNKYYKFLRECNSDYEETLINALPVISDMKKACLCLRVGYACGYLEGKEYAYKSFADKIEDIINNEDDCK